MKNTLTWITWLSLSAVSPFALAVGLGQANVSSYLDAPLDASIPLLESSDYTPDEIHVSVAEPTDFAAAGLEWTPLAASVRTRVQEQQGRRQVRLSSQQAMEEPWLELLLTIEYPGGQQAHDVTLLFDPQGYAQTASTAQVAAATAQNTTATMPAVATSPTTPPRVSEPDKGRSAYVGSGDTLWGVAERVKPAQSSVQQMMVALLEANPDIFPTGNIHDMRAGQTLRIPDRERILAYSHRDADAAIKAMNEAWRARRNGTLQATPFPENEAVAVSDIAVDATQTLHEEGDEASVEESGEASSTFKPDSALAAGGTEPSEPDADEPKINDQAVLEEATNEPEALTRAELTEQLRLSQTTLQQVLEERALMRAELNELRGEVASLTQALSEALTAREQGPAPRAASMGEDQSVSALMARYQWPLALVAIALLVALLVWLRKRREETWEDSSFAEPVVKPAVSPRATAEARVMHEAAPVIYPAQSNDADVDAQQNGTEKKTAIKEEHEFETKPEFNKPVTQSVSSLNPDQWLVNDQEQAFEYEGTLSYEKSYEKSQAAGLAEQGRRQRLGLEVNRSENVSLSPPPSAVSMRQMLASLNADLGPTEREAAVQVQPTELGYEASDDARHRSVDYHPPSLNGAVKSSVEQRGENLLQPTVEFTTESPPPTVKKPRRPIEEEWEIEEVAFKPRGLDNSEPSKSSK
ncbi:type IV pilus assembly protein FimV [Vreelandella sp. H-I2]